METAAKGINWHKKVHWKTNEVRRGGTTVDKMEKYENHEPINLSRICAHNTF